ncbi:hypothetical protein K1T71_006634 [Dendrolimus kikuchii]|uniref:Uncharacterized protein n=1 Tax=Dendrolimus kikuchii TaxID=765133 RepID=A0ACC1D1N8_9NEOP|nr:hypothetical protein K1T71_006634 [Dendrolimus kikuchii]
MSAATHCDNSKRTPCERRAGTVGTICYYEASTVSDELRKYPVLGFDNEKRIVAHILKLGDAGFPPDRIVIRQLAYQFAEKLGLKHTFNNESKMAGPQWLKINVNTKIDYQIVVYLR